MEHSFHFLAHSYQGCAHRKRSDLSSKKSLFAAPYKFAEFWLISISPTFEYDAPHPHTTVPFSGMTGYPKKSQERLSSLFPPRPAPLRRQTKEHWEFRTNLLQEALHLRIQCSSFSRSPITTFSHHSPHPRFSIQPFATHLKYFIIFLSKLEPQIPSERRSGYQQDHPSTLLCFSITADVATKKEIFQFVLSMSQKFLLMA